MRAAHLILSAILTMQGENAPAFSAYCDTIDNLCETVMSVFESLHFYCRHLQRMHRRCCPRMSCRSCHRTYYSCGSRSLWGNARRAHHRRCPASAWGLASAPVLLHKMDWQVQRSLSSFQRCPARRCRDRRRPSDYQYGHSARHFRGLCITRHLGKQTHYVLFADFM